MGRTYANYGEYWDAYLEAHSKRGTRALHYLATLVGVACGIWSLSTLDWRPVVAGILVGYVMAFSGHFLVERNKPLANRPIWGAVSDLRMCLLALTGRLRAQLERRALKRRGI